MTKDAPVAKSELEGHTRRIDERIDSIDGRIDERFESINGRISEQNASIHSMYSKMEALGLKIDALSSKFGESNATFQTVHRSFVPTPDLGLDGPNMADCTITTEEIQVGHMQGW